jgi:hypothetical protein
MNRRELIERFAAGPDAIEAAVAGASDEELDARPGEGEWTAREIVHHTADGEIRSALRLRQLLAEDDPVIQGYDEASYARRLPYARPIGSSLRAIRATREASTEMLRLLTDEDFSRSGTHTEMPGERYSVDRWLEIYAAHCHDHAAQIERALGKS